MAHVVEIAELGGFVAEEFVQLVVDANVGLASQCLPKKLDQLYQNHHQNQDLDRCYYLL